jgi:hypothetical protein
MQQVAGVEHGHRAAAAAPRRRRRLHQRLADVEHALVALAQRGPAAGCGGDEDRTLRQVLQERFTQPELSRQLATSRVEAIRASGATVVSCGNPGCALQLRTALRAAQLDVRIAHPAELVAEAAAKRY